VRANAGTCVAGRVVLGDGEQIINGEAVKINLNTSATWVARVYKGGWFILITTLPPQHASHEAVVVIRAFDYEPVDDKGTLSPGAITYLEYVLKPVSPNRRASITGYVIDDNNAPVAGALVGIGYPGASLGYSSETGNSEPEQLLLTKKDGGYAFHDLSPGTYRLWASKRGFATDFFQTILDPGEHEQLNLLASRNARLDIEFAYQPDGSRRFDRGGTVTGHLAWVNGAGGLDFSDGRVEGYEKDSLRDLEFRQKDGKLLFDISYVGSLRNGFYDAGPVSFRSVRRATTSGYTTAKKPCIEGHVYLVRTYEGHYAKFVVSRITYP